VYKAASFPVAGKKFINELRLSATDVTCSHAPGPTVSGPALSLFLAMTDRLAGLSGLSYDLCQH